MIRSDWIIMLLYYVSYYYMTATECRRKARGISTSEASRRKTCRYFDGARVMRFIYHCTRHVGFCYTPEMPTNIYGTSLFILITYKYSILSLRVFKGETVNCNCKLILCTFQ